MAWRGVVWCAREEKRGRGCGTGQDGTARGQADKDKTEPCPGPGQVVDGDKMVRALLPRATRSGLGGLKPSQLSRGLLPVDGWKSKRLEGRRAVGVGLQSVGALWSATTKSLTHVQKRRECVRDAHGEAQSSEQTGQGTTDQRGVCRGCGEVRCGTGAVRARGTALVG